MILATVNGERGYATPGLRGVCPGCGGRVIAKCGHFNVWHWAHEVADCDPWSEPESEWHRAWKNWFPKEWQEVVIGPHRADVHYNGLTLEFQHSPLPLSEIYDRESFYVEDGEGDEQFYWIVDVRDKDERMVIYSLREPEEVVGGREDGILTWERPCKEWVYCKGSMFLDPGNGVLFRVSAKGLSANDKKAVFLGSCIRYNEFVQWVKEEVGWEDNPRTFLQLLQEPLKLPPETSY